MPSFVRPNGAPEAPDVHGRVALVAGVELDRRLQLVQPADVERAARVDRGGVEHGDGERHVLRAFFTATGRDVNVLQVVFPAGVLPVLGGQYRLRRRTDQSHCQCHCSGERGADVRAVREVRADKPHNFSLGS